MEAHTKIEEVVRLFGDPILSMLNAKMKYKDIVDKYKKWKPQTPEQEDRLMRGFILALLGNTLCNDNNADDLPWEFLWLCAPDVWETSHNLEQFRTTLRYITTDQVNWYLWEIKDAILHDYVQNSILMIKQRILLQGQARYAWYVGERVFVQSLGTQKPRVPKILPRTMLKDMKVFALDKETKASHNGFNSEDWFAESMEYRGFRNQYVMYTYYLSMDRETMIDGVTSVALSIQGSVIKILPWTVQVVQCGDGDDYEVLDIPRGKSNMCLPLPEDVKCVSISTTSELLDMNSELNSLLFTKCIVARTIIRELRQESEENDENDQENEDEDEEDEILVEKIKTKSPSPKTEEKGVVVKT
ncbi:hypothetical protein L3X38_010066 [Prunus dulcis]|uniref:Uncharacterized protein n=1 Tax=Prunus dulcis TaxID=3755 RepID=A0AAD4WFH7_PRUDU|nr:hypothetical protein L3X38_010066 [Prunus dulcis]